MSRGNISDGSRKPRLVLGDVTNLPAKRGFSSILGDGCVENLECAVGSSNSEKEFAKKVCLQVENLVKEKCKTNDKESGISSPNNSENVVCVVSNAPDKDKNNNDNNHRMPDLGVTVAHKVVELGDTSGEGCVSTISIPKKDGDCERRFVSDAILPKDMHEELLVSCVSGGKDPGVGSLFSGKCGSNERLTLPKSQGSRSFELERCEGLKGDHCANLSTGSDLLKDCSCSFCLTAAYMWSDLHYQDIKGRIAALKKSQKEASSLAEKCGRGKQIDIPGQGNSHNLSKLESDLMSHWKSLFLHMEDIFVNESSQLQASFLALNDLRENCKMDLGRTTEMPLDKQ